MRRPALPTRRPLAPVRAARLAALAMALLGAGCTGPSAADCPGTDLGTLHLAGTLSTSSCAAGAPAAGMGALYPATVGVDAVFAYSATGSGAAVCLVRTGALPFQGTRTAGGGGDQLDVSVDTTRAVLLPCSAACAVAVQQTISGTLTRDGVSGAPTGFTGTLTEVASGAALSDCGPCTLPCGATWAITGAP